MGAVRTKRIIDTAGAGYDADVFFGEVAERLNAPVSKTGRPARVAGVRISPSPLKSDTKTSDCQKRRQKLLTFGGVFVSL